MTPFRPYKSELQFICDNGIKVTEPITINLFDVRSYTKADNSVEGFDDEKMRTVVNTDNKSYLLLIDYNSFDGSMLQFYSDYCLLDLRSAREQDAPDKVKYKGMMDFRITGDDKMIAVTFYRKGYEVHDYNDAVFNCLFKSITPLN